MQRTIETLAGDRRRLEERFQQQVDALRAAARALAGLEARLSAAGAAGRKSGILRLEIRPRLRRPRATPWPKPCA